jgi:hypothetical protein
MLSIADEHSKQEFSLAELQTAVADKWAEAEANARSNGSPFKLENVRWAVRRILFRPDLWREADPHQIAARRAALEKVLVLCKD